MEGGRGASQVRDSEDMSQIAGPDKCSAAVLIICHHYTCSELGVRFVPGVGVESSFQIEPLHKHVPEDQDNSV